jgi:hypothetical protein
MAHPPLLPGENFHLVGRTQAFDPLSPPVAAATERVVNIDNDDDDVVETSRTGRRRHWTPDEEGRLVIIYIYI